MKTRIHVDQHRIRRNRKTGERQPPISCKTYKGNAKATEVYVDGPCRVVYRPDAPLPCGATVWVETESKTVVVR